MEEKNRIYIKNMVCRRCIMVVTELLERLGLAADEVALGRVTLREPLTGAQRNALRSGLLAVGFDLIDDRRTRLFEQIRNAVIRLAGEDARGQRVKLSDYLQQACLQDYSALSKLFSEVKGVSIERYYTALRIERAKELLAYDELALNEIADRLGFSSSAHLSARFKSVTGLSPSQFKRSRTPRRLPLDEV